MIWLRAVPSTSVTCPSTPPKNSFTNSFPSAALSNGSSWASIDIVRVRVRVCGFCFVEYETRADALQAKKLLDGMKLDERFVRVDLDPGFKDGRQFGRGRSGGQVRDEFRKNYDAGRGGWGGASQEKLDQFRESKQRSNYQ